MTRRCYTGQPATLEQQFEVDGLSNEEMLLQSLVAAKIDAFHLRLTDRRMLRQGALFKQLGVPESLDSQEYLARIHPSDRLERDSVIALCTAEQPQYSTIYRFTSMDGQVFWLSEEAEIRFDHTGEKVALLGICRDVTGSRHQQERLLARERDAINREERLRRVMDHQLGLVGIIDLDGILLEVDNTSMTIAGTSREQVIGKHFADTSFWNYDKAIARRIREAMRRAFKGEVVRFDVPLASTNGDTLMIDFMLAPLYDEQGAVEFLIPSGVDISERKQAEQALLASENRLRVGVAVANLALAEIDYLSDTAHLTREAAQLYGLDESPSCVSVEQLHTFIHEEDRAWVLALIDEQLASADGDSIHCQYRLQFADASVRWVEVRMQFFFNNAHGDRQPYKSTLAARDITEQKSADGRLLESETRFRSMIDDLPNLIWVHDDKGQLQTVNRTFRGFFGAALTYANGQQDRSRLHFSVVDSGIGMSTEIQARLFTPFSQGDDSVSRLFGGTGLGLAISQRLARLLGGEIVVDSETGRGSCFSFTIAVGDVSAQPLITVNSDHAVVVVEPIANDITLDCCVLVVDDQRDVRVMVKRFLEKASATVCMAEDGIEALSVVRQSMRAGSPLIDLVLLDMQMPRLDGYNTARQLRGMGFKAPIVALTADALQADMSICLTSGCDAYLSKPVNSRDLLTTIRHYTQGIGPVALEEQRSRVTAEGGKAGNRPDATGRLPDEGPTELPTGATSLQVLIVDDATDVCRSLQRLLKRKGVQAECAHDGESALQMLCEVEPNVVILDINLPDMSGLELVKLMRAQLDSPDTQFIALSGHVGRESYQRSVAAGFDTHLEKPVEIGALLAAIGTGQLKADINSA